MYKDIIKSGSAIVGKILARSINTKLVSLLKKYSTVDKKLTESLISLIPNRDDFLIGFIGDDSFYFNPSLLTKRERELAILAFKDSKIDSDKLDSVSSYLMNSIEHDKKLIITSTSSGVEATAHEIGHAFNDTKLWSKVLQGRIVSSISKVDLVAIVSSLALSLFGKESLSVLVPLIVKSPLLATEFTASKIGLDLLKKAGATEEQMNRSKKALASAWGTYLSYSLGISLTGMAYSPILKSLSFSDNKTYILKRRNFAVVRNPYQEKVTKDLADSGMIDEEGNLVQQTEEPIESNDLKIKDNKLVKDDKSKSLVYQNLDKTRNQKVNDITSKDRNRLRNRTVNQNVNITRNTNISNPSKEKAAELDAQVKMAKLDQKASQNGGVNEKLIEIQKTNPLKPLSMDGR